MERSSEHKKMVVAPSVLNVAMVAVNVRQNSKLRVLLKAIQ